MHRPFSGDSPPPNCLHGCFSSSSFPGDVTSSDPPHGPTPTVTSATLRRNFAQTTSSTIFPETHFTDPNSLPSLEESFSHFLQAYPNYTDTYKIDRIRSDHYFHLGLTHYTCLDYIGIGLYSYSQLLNYDPSTYQISSSLSESPFFSVSPKIGNLKEKLLHDGGQETEFEYSMKRRIMGFLKISEEDYSMVFTANRTSAFRLVAESYPFSKRKLLTVYDYESEAVDEINRISEKRGAKVAAAEFSWPGLRICSSKLRKMVTAGKSGSNKKKKKGIFVFPLHSRVTGSRYPYLWMSVAQENGWHVMIDACGLGPKDMDSFGLSIYNPDFMVCSFYKVFGENPSGFGCLFVKKSTIPILESSTGSGMVNLVPTDDPISLQSLEINRTQKETEEVDDIISSGIEYRGLDHVDSLGLVATGNRSRCLINWLVSALYKLKHSTTSRLVKIYGPKVNFNRGPAIAFNLFDQKGGRIEPFIVQKLADCSNISLGQGFLKKISFEEEYEGVKDRVLEKRKNEQGISVITAALGFLANFEDVYKLWIFVARFLDSGFVETESVRCGVHVFEHKSREVV